MAWPPFSRARRAAASHRNTVLSLVAKRARPHGWQPWLGWAWLAWLLSFMPMAHALPHFVEDTANPARAIFTAVPNNTDLYGAIWMRCPIGMGWDDGNKQCTGTATPLTRAEAAAEVKKINEANGGTGTLEIKNWMIPDMSLLGSLIDANSKTEPKYETDIFANIPGNHLFWTSSPVIPWLPSSRFLWNLHTGAYDSDLIPNDSAKYYVLLVSPTKAALHKVTLNLGPNGTVDENVKSHVNKGTVEFNFSPRPGYELDQVTEVSNPGSCIASRGFLPGSPDLSVVVGTADCEYSVSFKRMAGMFLIDASTQPSYGGNLACPSYAVNNGDDLVCTVQTRPGYRLESLTGCDEIVGNDCKLHRIEADKAIEARLSMVRSFSGTTVPTPGTAGVAGTAVATLVDSDTSHYCRFDEAKTAFVAAPSTGLPADKSMPQGMLQYQLIDCDYAKLQIEWPQPVPGFNQWGYASYFDSYEQKATYFEPSALTIAGTRVSYTTQNGSLGDDDWNLMTAIDSRVGPLAVTNLAITPPALPAAPASTPIDIALAVDLAATSIAPQKFSATGLPAGLRLSSLGVLSGALAAGNYPFTVYVEDAAGSIGSQSYTLEVTGRTLTFTPPAALSTFVAGAASSAQFSSNDGVGPYSWQASGLPDGLSFSSTGLLQGSVASGQPRFDVTVTDSLGTSGTQSVTLGIAQAPSTTTLKPPAILTMGAASTVTATVSAPAGNTLTPTGEVSISGAGGSCKAPLQSGSASCTLTPLVAGANQMLTASYAGDLNFAASKSTATVQVSSSSTQLTASSSPNPSQPGQPVQFMVQVASKLPPPAAPSSRTKAAPAPTGTISLSENGKLLASAALGQDGSAQLELSVLTTAGEHMLVIDYSGDDNYAPANLGYTQTVATPVATPVPTLGEWAWLLLSALLATAAMLAGNPRKRQ